MSFWSRLLGKDKAPPAAQAEAKVAASSAAPGDVPPDAEATHAAPPPPAAVSLHAVPPAAAPAPIKVPKFKGHVAFDGAVSIAQAPGGKAWRIVEDGREGQGFLAMSLMFIRDAEPAPLVLLAKIFTLTDGRKPNDPSTTDWRAGFASLFSAIDRVDQVVTTQSTLQDPLPATEVRVEGTSPDGEFPLCIRERRAVHGHEEFMVTAMGPRELCEQHAVRIDAWFASVVFVPAPAI
ncbi:MAG: hypothetical protein KBG15_11990 [Kofleriaceae bacterium]|nr:hypothetical protein [Kofleriaceae bacterium]